MRIENVYHPGSPVCAPEDTLAEVARKMRSQNVDALVLQAAGRVRGIVSEHDIVRAIANGVDPRIAVADMCATREVHVADLDNDTSDVVRRMLDLRIRRMPVVSDDRVIGMVSMRELLALEAWAS